MCKLSYIGKKTAKTNPKRPSSLPKVFKETSALRVSFPDGINKFVGADSYHLTPLDSFNDNETDTDDDSDLVADVDPDTLICIVGCELKMVWLQL